MNKGEKTHEQGGKQNHQTPFSVGIILISQIIAARKVKDFSNMWISKDKNTDSGTGIPCTSYDILGSSIPMSKVEGKIVVSDMANTFYFGRTTDSNNMVVDVKYETYYEK